MSGRTATNGLYAWSDPNSYVRSYATNGLNQYSATSVGGSPQAYTYDPNGNLTSDGIRAYVYDVENRLVSASGGATAALVYDPLGRLFQTSGGSAVLTQFLYDGDELVSEFNSAGTVLLPLKGVLRLGAIKEGVHANENIFYFTSLFCSERMLTLDSVRCSPCSNAVRASRQACKVAGPYRTDRSNLFYRSFALQRTERRSLP